MGADRQPESGGNQFDRRLQPGTSARRWNDVKIRGRNQPLGGRRDRVTLFVNRQGATSGPNPPLGGDEGMTFAIWGPWENGAL